MQTIDLVYRTMFADLVQRTLDASFEADFSETGNFVRVPVSGRDYWYFDEVIPRKARKYVGPASDPEISKRVSAFREIKDDFRARRKIVSTLIRQVGLMGPDMFTGDVVAALERGGIFRLRGLLIGTVSFQAYAGYLGVKLPSAALQTSDADFAQHHAISALVEDSIPPILDILHSVDPTFREIPHRSDAQRVTQFENAKRYKIEFLTPNRGSSNYEDHASPMPALGGASAQPIRFLDYLIRDPIRTVLLHRGGVAVTVPSPERYAVHKLIVASRRRQDPNGMSKREKDVYQSRLLFEALDLTRRLDDLGVVFSEAWRRGNAWKSAIEKGLSLMRPGDKEVAVAILSQALSEAGESLEGFPVSQPFPPGPGRA